MNWVDGLIVTALLYGMWRGAARGLGQEGLQLAGAFGGVAAAYLWGEQAALALAERFLLPEWLAKPLAIAGVALAVAFAGHVLGVAWVRWVEASGLAAWDRWAGAMLGFLQATVVCGAALVLWIEWPGRAFPESVEGSLLARGLLSVLPSLYANLKWLVAPLR